MINVYFMHRIKRTNNEYEKGIEVKNLARQEGETDEALSKRNYEAAEQSYHAYLGAYAYGQNPQTDYVQVEITDLFGAHMMAETWQKTIVVPETIE